MKRYLFPNMYVDSILDIPFEQLWDAGIRAFLLDLDNTVTEWNRMEISEEIIRWVEAARNHGFQACLLSNNDSHRRVFGVAEKLGVPYILKARKPRNRGFAKAMQLLGTRPEETAVVGDQVFTDVLGGNRMGMYTILVVPMNPREFLGTRFMRQIERFVLRGIREAAVRGDINNLPEAKNGKESDKPDKTG